MTTEKARELAKAARDSVEYDYWPDHAEFQEDIGCSVGVAKQAAYWIPERAEAACDVIDACVIQRGNAIECVLCGAFLCHEGEGHREGCPVARWDALNAEEGK